MHPTTQALFDEHANPTHCGKREVHDLASPLLQMGVKVQAQIAQYRSLLLAAELADHDHALDGKYEQIHQKLGGLDKVMPEFLQAGRTVATAFTALDKLMADAKVDIVRYDAAQPPSTP